MNSVLVLVPSVSIDAVLASPNHSDSIQGLTLHDTSTPIAIKIVAIDVGSYYHAGTLYPATVDLVLTTPGGAQLHYDRRDGLLEDERERAAILHR